MTDWALLAYQPIIRAAGDSAGTALDALTPLFNYGVLGLVLLLILLGWLVPRPGVADLKADRDAWRTAFDKEREGHQVTQSALQVAQGQAALSLETSKTLTSMFDRLGHAQTRDRDGGG